ncbi:MAG: VCBS repeat-containing protein, partial [Thermoplasmata archaeon]|nr:VCBS repeat-containing protein [Thermoplasmata archaeon]
MKGKRMCATILVALMCFSGLAIITVGMDSETSTSIKPTFVGDGEESTHSRSTEETATPILEDSKIFPATQTISKTVTIPAGKQYYVWYDGTTKTLQGMQLPDYTAGLTPNALDALAKTPDWLDEDLAKKFGWLADIDINVGSRSTPTFADVDGDEDLDLVVGESGGTLKYYENADNAFHYYEGEDFFIGAVYVEGTTMFSGIDIGTNSDPAFADLDGDGDEDLTIGAANGFLYYYRNDGGTWTYLASMYSGVSVVGYSTPSFADMDGDNDFDLTIGASDGAFTYYRNDGTVSSPSWIEIIGYYSGIDVGDYSNPALADMDDDGDIDLTSGESFGTVKYYSNNGGSWVEDTEPYTGIDVGTYSAPALADLDFNLCYDLSVGANNGLLYYHENKGTAASYDKLTWLNSPTSFTYVQLSNYYRETVTLKHRGDTSYENTYAELINTAPDLWVDEIAFSIAHTSTDTLKNDDGDGEDVYPEVFRENAEYIYDIDPHLDYVDIVEKTGPDGDYTTLQYWVDDPVEGLIQYEISRDIYYWYVVHPKIEDELPTFVDPNESSHLVSNSEPSPVGQFWRPFFFYHNDGGYPLLKDRLAGIGTLWNCTQNDKVENGAVGVVTQWIQDSWSFTSDTERPHEPVRIYRKHIGRCGEHADITTA